MNTHDDHTRTSEAPVSRAPDERVTDVPPAPPSPRRPVPPVGESAWRGWAVRIFLAVLLLAGVFALGHWLGRSRAVHEHGGAGTAAPAHEAAGEEVLYWTCSMHPQVKLPKPGQCPICFMDLIPVRAGQDTDPNAPKLTLSARARELAEVETAPVALRELTHEIRMVGKITADETRITHVSSYIPGRLDRLFVNYTGILVKKGDHLAEIYSPDLLVAQREYLLAQDALERARKGAGQSETAVQTAQALYEAARRKLELWGIPKDELDHLAREKRPSDHMRIDSPLEGWVLERQGFQGMYVETGTRIFTLADLRHVWVQLDAYELDISFIRLGQQVEFETEAFPGQVFKGRVSYIDPVLNPSTRTVKVRVNVENPGLKLRPEMFVRARLNVRVGEGGKVVDNALAGKWLCYMHPEVVKDGPGQCDICGMDLVTAESLGYAEAGVGGSKVMAIPRTAVLRTGTRAVVYVENKDEKDVNYEGRVIELGPRAGDYYVVMDGLREGERVVTRGALMIDSALQIQAKPSMMQPREDHLAESQPDESVPEAPSRYVAGAEYHQHAAPVVKAYLDLTEALAADNAVKSDEAVAGLRAAMKGAVPHGLEGEAAETFRAQMAAIESALPAGTASIDGLRGKLPELTRTVETYLRTFGHEGPQPVVKVFCSMAFENKGAYWLQSDSQVRNPYFGKKMLRCGEVKATLEPGGRPKTDNRPATGPSESRSRYVAGAMYHQHARPVLDGYLELVKSLAADDAGGTASALGNVGKALKGAVPHGLEGESAEVFKKQMDVLESSLPPATASIADVRAKLPALTRALSDYLKTFGHNRSEPVVQVFCSMAFDDKGASWLQADRQVRNPYFAKKMLRCGEVQGAIEPDGSVKR
ncbi:MAG: hypothetical protein AMXMBFR13_48970 [Phycisphaerae bacterium]